MLLNACLEEQKQGLLSFLPILNILSGKKTLYHVMHNVVF